MGDDVAERLLGAAEQQALAVESDAEVPSDIDIDLEAGRRDTGRELFERAREADGREVRRMDVDDQRPELADRHPDGTGALRERALRLLPRSRGDALTCRTQRVRRAGELRYDPVMEVGCDPAPFDVRRVDGSLEQPLALGVSGPDTPRELPRERYLEQPDQRDRREQCEGRPAPKGQSADARLIEPLVELEQDGPPGRRHHDRKVNLQ